MLDSDYKRFVKALSETKSCYDVNDYGNGKIHLYSGSFDHFHHDLKVFKSHGFTIMWIKEEFIDDCFSIVIA